MNTSLLTWIALLVITGLAIFLYYPRKFSGPLTEHERRMAHRGRTRRSFALVLVTPLATIIGLLLLARPPVALEVRSRAAPASVQAEPTTSAERPLLASLSWHESTWDWTSAVLCRIDALRSGDDAALADAVLAAAGDGFSIPDGCPVSNLTNDFTARDFRSVELSLVELAARAYNLTDVEIHAGPRLQDPDPWDVMASLLRERGLTPRLSSTRAAAEAGRILRLGHARVSGQPPRFEVLALVHGAICQIDDARIGPVNDPIATCTLRNPDCSSAADPEQRVVSMSVECEDVDLSAIDGYLLSVHDGETMVNAGSLIIHAGSEVKDALEVVGEGRLSQLFSEEMRRHGLLPLVAADDAEIDITTSDDSIVITHRRPRNAIPKTCQPSLDRGPFSWSGLVRPEIRHTPDTIEIVISPAILGTGSEEYDPTGFLATFYTITWAANALNSGRCLELGAPPERDSYIPAHPVLSARQMDEAVAGLRRTREALGLVLIALAVLTLALGLRRSAL